MIVPTSDEYVVDPPPMRRLPDNLLNSDFCVWILVGPRPARSLTADRPRVVIVNAAPVQRLEPGQEANACAFRRSVEVPCNDGRQLASMPAVQIDKI